MVYLYDGTYEGLLTAVFEIYAHKQIPEAIGEEGKITPSLFAESEKVITQTGKSERVLKKLYQILPAREVVRLYRVFLSENIEREMLIYRFIVLALGDAELALSDFRNLLTLKMKSIDKQMGREVHRMHAFVRFQRTADDIWFAAIEPDFDVMPLIGHHFKQRYADQRWVIYDAKRQYGLYYDLSRMDFISLDFSQDFSQLTSLSENVLHEEETSYQALWKDYFDSVNIKARKNLKLHIRHIPKRYWKYLFEKQGSY